MLLRPPTRFIETIIRPIDHYARDEQGKPLKCGPPCFLRVVGVTDQRDIAERLVGEAPWHVSTLSADDDIDFGLFRQCLRRYGLVGMGVVPGAPWGAGAVILVPVAGGFGLHGVDPAGPFEGRFSQRQMTMLVDNWPERVAPQGLGRSNAVRNEVLTAGYQGQNRHTATSYPPAPRAIDDNVTTRPSAVRME